MRCRNLLWQPGEEGAYCLRPASYRVKFSRPMRGRFLQYQRALCEECVQTATGTMGKWRVRLDRLAKA